MNVMQLVKGEERWTMIDNHTWDMILGKSGKLPGALAPEIIELAKSKGYEFTDEDPQVNYPDELDKYRKEMDDNGWEYSGRPYTPTRGRRSAPKAYGPAGLSRGSP